jgi:hypothetical protein
MRWAQLDAFLSFPPRLVERSRRRASPLRKLGHRWVLFESTLALFVLSRVPLTSDLADSRALSWVMYAY